jgi:hypothetical protein
MVIYVVYKLRNTETCYLTDVFNNYSYDIDKKVINLIRAQPNWLNLVFSICLNFLNIAFVLLRDMV